ncbi:MAG: hypothetical protein ACKPJD_07950, partial [Planctomycetaceae bacterium]
MLILQGLQLSGAERNRDEFVVPGLPEWFLQDTQVLGDRGGGQESAEQSGEFCRKLQHLKSPVEKLQCELLRGQ